jgi:hypothetical protein
VSARMMMEATTGGASAWELDDMMVDVVRSLSAVAHRPPAWVTPVPPRPSGALPRLPHLDDAPTETVALTRDVAARFRTICALRAEDPARVLESLARSYVILGLAERKAT